MRIALTGITGFIGQALMPQLLAEGCGNEYLTLSRSPEKAGRLYPAARYRRFTHAAATDFGSLTRFRPEVVVHLAALSTAGGATADIGPLIAANVEYGARLLDALRQCASVRLFVNTGTFAEYRGGTARPDSAYLYAATKRAFRAFVDYYASLAPGFRRVTAVPYTVYGGTMTVRRLFDYMLESQRSAEPVDMTAGEQVLDFVHVSDVARFFCLAATRPERFLAAGDGREYHLGTGHGTSVRQAAALMERLSGRRCNIRWGGRPYRERDIMRAVAPVACNEPCGWKAAISLEEGMRRFLDSHGTPHTPDR